MTTIVLFGANGQLGREILNCPHFNNVKLLGYAHSDVDITDEKHIRETLKNCNSDLVINCAAYTKVDDAEDNARQAFVVNEDGARALARSCNTLDIPLIHLSTDYVFDGRQEQPYREDDPVNPLSVYGASKLAGENAIIAEHDKFIIVRTSWVFGVHGKNFVYTIARLARDKKVLTIVSDQKGCPTGTRSIAAAISKISNRILVPGFSGWGKYHYCGSPATNWFEFAGKIIEKLRLKTNLAVEEIKPVSTREFTVRATRPQNSVLNCDKIIREFNIEPADWRDDLADMIDSEVFSSTL